MAGARHTRRLVVVAIALVVLVGVAWGIERYIGRTNVSGQDFALKVTRNGKQIDRFTTAELEKMPQRRVITQGMPETGPSLLSVLRAAGVTSFTRVSVIGAGVRDVGRLDLNRSDVTEDVVLDIAYRGTAKIAGPKIPREQRVRDIVELRVQ